MQFNDAVNSDFTKKIYVGVEIINVRLELFRDVSEIKLKGNGKLSVDHQFPFPRVQENIFFQGTPLCH